MRTHTIESQKSVTPATALDFLAEGNKRFQLNLKANRNLLQQVNETSEGQFPFAAILSCIDSRTSAELIFDQGLGDIFSIRIAGNFVNDDILGSLEYACQVAGSKLVVVLGHTRCGAVTAACNGPAEGHIGHLLEKVRPAVDAVKERGATSTDPQQMADEVAEVNVAMAVENIRLQSPVLAKLENEGKIGLIGALYDVTSGVVNFFPDTASASVSKGCESLQRA